MSSHSRPSVSSTSTREPLLGQDCRRDFWTNSVEPEAGECGSIGPPSAIPVSLSDSESTVSNRPGLGFTLDKSLTKAADKVVRILTRMSEGLGRGPNALMGRMLISGEWGAYPCHSRYCRVHQDSLGPSILWSSPSVDNVLDILFSPYCPQCRERYVKSLTRSEVFLDGCRKLVEGVREPNPSARRLHAYYISALSYFHSSFRCRFLELGADNALRDLRNEGKLWPRDFLVGPATRALFSLTETVIMPVVRVFDEQKRKVDAYFPRPLPEHDLSAIEAQTCDFVSTLLQALASPSLQVLAAYHLSLALVLSYHGLTQMVAPLSRALNAEVVDWLWGQLLRSEDPVARGALGRLLCNLYDFLSYAAFTSKWSADIGVSAGIWLWRTLWVPFFDLRSDLVSVVAIRKHVVCRVCKVFFRWSRTASSICYEAQADIQELLVKYEPSTLTRKRRRLSQDQESPITVLIQKIASPLFRLAASLEKERRISQSPHLHEIDRAIPRLLLSEVVGNIADVAINNSATLDAAVSISPVLKCAVPWHDSVCRYEVRRSLEKYLWHSDTLLRDNARAALNMLYIDRKQYEFRCTGIVVGVLENGLHHGLRVFDEHSCLPYRPRQSYRSERPAQRLITSSTWRDVRWVSYADIAEQSRYYQPIVYTIDSEVYWIGCTRNTSLPAPELTLLPWPHSSARDAIDDGDFQVNGLHILSAVVMGKAENCPVFWLTGSQFVHALTGEIQTEFDNHHKIYRHCLCHRLWLDSGHDE